MKTKDVVETDFVQNHSQLNLVCEGTWLLPQDHNVEHSRGRDLCQNAFLVFNSCTSKAVQSHPYRYICIYIPKQCELSFHNRHKNPVYTLRALYGFIAFWSNSVSLCHKPHGAFSGQNFTPIYIYNIYIYIYIYMTWATLKTNHLTYRGVSLLFIHIVHSWRNISPAYNILVTPVVQVTHTISFKYRPTYNSITF